MTIYIDDLLRQAVVRHGHHTVRGRWSHLMADGTGELLAFGTRLYLRRSWLQKPGSPLEHFPVTAAVRFQAIALGAVQITHEEGRYLTRAKRADIAFDLPLLRTDVHSFEAALALASRARSERSGPARIRLSRAAGWRLPPNAVSVAAPTPWANPFRPASRTPEANEAAVAHFTRYLHSNPKLVAQATIALRGRHLACWCAPHLACHADVWLNTVNSAPTLNPEAAITAGCSSEVPDWQVELEVLTGPGALAHRDAEVSR